ncbi:hypothetical protein SELMODRAFT_420678 [Selaginella moellendorffii]|uniref:Uncharacterized protein n=1 Tax=Selaginella moellendorffii TaxID=88036 RepID=D8SCS1_SELML|nr:hypothetical protein SELMODRAFT_420678 [Selaginella moellendorffii]
MDPPGEKLLAPSCARRLRGSLLVDLVPMAASGGRQPNRRLEASRVEDWAPLCWDLITWQPGSPVFHTFSSPPPPGPLSIAPPLGSSSSSTAAAAAAAAFATPGLLVAGIVLFLLAMVAIITGIWILVKGRRKKANDILVRYVGSSHLPGGGSSSSGSQREYLVPLSKIEDAELRDKLNSFVQERSKQHLRPSQLCHERALATKWLSQKKVAALYAPLLVEVAAAQTSLVAKWLSRKKVAALYAALLVEVGAALLLLRGCAALLLRGLLVAVADCAGAALLLRGLLVADCAGASLLLHGLLVEVVVLHGCPALEVVLFHGCAALLLHGVALLVLVEVPDCGRCCEVAELLSPSLAMVWGAACYLEVALSFWAVSCSCALDEADARSCAPPDEVETTAAHSDG